MDEAPHSGQFVVGESFARILTETTQSLVCVLDRDGRILLFNEACERATGFRRDEVLGRDARDFVIPAEEREAFGEFLAYVWKTGTPSPQVGHWQTKDGGRRLIAWSNRPMTDADGRAGVARHDRHRPDRPRAAPGADERALEGDPEAKLAEVARLASEQRALRRVATLVAAEVSPERVFTARVRGVRARAAGQRVGGRALRGRRDGDDRRPPQPRQHRRLPGRRGAARPTSDSAIGRVLRTGAPARIDDWGGSRGEIAEAMFRAGYRSSAAAPIVVAGALWGAVAIASEDPLPPDTEKRLGAFCELVSLAVASAQARADLIASRARLVKAGDEQRRRLERNLHDGAQQRLVSVALKLRVARAQLEAEPDVAAALLDEALARARHRPRGAARDRARPASGDPRRARPRPRAGGARRAAAGPRRRSTCPTSGCPTHIEATAYYIVSEALTNVAKHADAGGAHVSVRRDGGMLRCEISDDGRGGADAVGGTASSACATAPRRRAARCRSSARPAAGRSCRRRCRWATADAQPTPLSASTVASGSPWR